MTYVNYLRASHEVILYSILHLAPSKRWHVANSAQEIASIGAFCDLEYVSPQRGQRATPKKLCTSGDGFTLLGGFGRSLNGEERRA